MSIKKAFIARIYLAFAFVCLLGFAIIFKAANIQITEGEHYRALADSMSTSYRTIDAERGNVYAADMSFLATSLPFFEVRMDLASPSMDDEYFYDHVDSLAWLLGQFDKNRDHIQWRDRLAKARAKGSRYLLIARKISYPELLKMKTWPIFRGGKYKGGFISLQQHKRVNPCGMLAHRTIGYVRDDIKPVGLEGSFNQFIGGTRGKRLMQKISGGVWVPINDDNEIEPVNGNDLITNLDVNIQDVAEAALESALHRHDADHGTAIVMEVKTGKIRAIANLGKAGDGYWENYNYAVGETHEPGSTFKLASMIALLEDKKVNVEDSVDLEKGRKKYYDFTIRDATKHDIRNVTVKRAFEISSNVGIAKLVNDAYGANPSQFVDRIRELGLGDKTGIEIEGEGSPYIQHPTSETWSGVSLPQMSIGYEIKLTPLQTLTLYNAVANDGKMMKPYLVDEIQEFGRTIQKFDPVVIKENICSPKTLSSVREMLEGVVENGTARNLRSEYFSIAGKTGTAQIADYKKGYGHKIYLASFAGYFPANKPVYSCIVVITAPSNGVYYGGSVAGPVFKEIADKIYANSLQLQPDVKHKEIYYAANVPLAKAGDVHDAKTIYNTLGISHVSQSEDWIDCSRNEHSVQMKEREVMEGLIPNVRGMGLKDALFLMEREGIKVRLKGRGKVTSQSVRPGLRARRGQLVTLTLS